MPVTFSHPIQNLSEDILLCIFTLNADMFSDKDALRRTTRLTSQVCQTWRNLMLNAPVLWARLIDIDDISSCCSNEWLDEIMRRSGAAPLWIKAEQHHPSVDIFRIISENWDRIQKLHIVLLHCTL